jgi:hypothetical protein
MECWVLDPQQKFTVAQAQPITLLWQRSYNIKSRWENSLLMTYELLTKKLCR